MKKKLWFLLLLGALMSLMCITSLAAEPAGPGIYDLNTENGISGVTITPQKADGTVLTAADAEIDDKAVSIYADAVKLQLDYTAAQDGSQYLVVLLSDTSGVPTEGNIAYIDQSGAGSSGVTFTLYPKSLAAGNTYGIYLSSDKDSSFSTLTRVATFRYYMPYKPGDVDESGTITATDALYALQISVGRPNSPFGIPWTSKQKLAADVDGIPGITASDALYILEASVGRRKL